MLRPRHSFPLLRLASAVALLASSCGYGYECRKAPPLPDGTVVDDLDLPAARAALAKRIVDARAIQDKAAKEKRSLQPTELESIDKILAEADPIQIHITALMKEGETRARLKLHEDWQTANPGRKTDPENPGRQSGEEAPNQDNRSKARSIAFRRWLRHGESRMTGLDRELMGPSRALGQEERESHGMDPELRSMIELAGGDPAAAEHRDMAVGTGAAGGYGVAPLFQSDISRAALAFSGVRQAGAQHMPTDTGADLPFMTGDDTGNAATLIAEAAGLGASDATLGQKIISTYMFTTGIVKVSVQLLNDGAFNVEAYLNEILAERIGRGTNTYWTTGTGSSQPEGIVVALGTSGAGIGVTAASATAITADELLNLQHSVDRGYRDDPSSGYGFSDPVLNKIRLLKDSYGRYLLHEGNGGITDGAPGKLWGKPFNIFSGMQQTLATNTKTVIYGRMRDYKTREVRGATMFRFGELYMANAQVGFVMFSRWGGAYVKPGTFSIKALLQA